MNILLIEDNLTIIKGLKYNLELNNYIVNYKNNIKDSITYINNNSNIDLIILDITLPDGDGFNLYENIIKSKNIPTIFLTAKDSENDIVKGLDLGGEDYITKPFSSKELLSRIKKVLLRNNKQNIITIKDISFDIDKMLFYKNNSIIELTSLETKLLSLLFLNKNKLVTRDNILETIYDYTGNDVDNHTVTVYFNRIRDKVGKDLIVTSKGLGYRIDEK